MATMDKPQSHLQSNIPDFEDDSVTEDEDDKEVMSEGSAIDCDTDDDDNNQDDDDDEDDDDEEDDGAEEDTDAENDYTHTIDEFFMFRDAASFGDMVKSNIAFFNAEIPLTPTFLEPLSADQLEIVDKIIDLTLTFSLFVADFEKSCDTPTYRRHGYVTGLYYGDVKLFVKCLKKYTNLNYVVTSNASPDDIYVNTKLNSNLEWVLSWRKEDGSFVDNDIFTVDPASVSKKHFERFATELYNPSEDNNIVYFHISDDALYKNPAHCCESLSVALTKLKETAEISKNAVANSK